MNNTIYNNCQNNDSMYCEIVGFVGDIPEQNNYIYDISYFMFFIAFILVILSPIYLLYRLINGVRK